MRWLLLVGVVGCYSPSVHPGAPCGPGGACPGNLTCAADSTCEPPHDGGGADTSPVDAPVPLIDAGLDACTTCIAPENDRPDGAIDITDGGDFTADVTYAHDDAQEPAQGSSCGNDGGLDVFYTIHLTSPEVFYFDTFGSDFDTVIRVLRDSACTAGIAPMGTTCRNDECGTAQTQYATSLPAGDSCLIIDGLDAAQTGHVLKLHVERGRRDGKRVAASGSIMGDTTGDSNVWEGSCSMHGAADHAYYLTACPGESLDVTASTCNQAGVDAGWDTALYGGSNDAELACNDDANASCSLGGGLSEIAFTASGAHLFWVVIDAGSPDNAGPYTLDVTL